MLFLDEIQSCPELIAILRYFYEEMPELAIICAGSLLEFAFNEKEFSVPVGRIEYHFMGPILFSEFLYALGHNNLNELLNTYELKGQIPLSIHNQLLQLLKVYFIVGGMPESVLQYVQTQGSFFECNKVHENITTTFRDDFAKYKKRIPEDRIRKVFNSLPGLVGKKFKYVNIDPSEKAKEINKVLLLLEYAKIFYPTYHSSCASLPLASQVNHKFMKPLFLDIGLMANSMGVSYELLNSNTDLNNVNQGILTEQFIGQHLLYSGPSFKTPYLYYWGREKKNSSAEVDYVVSVDTKIVPIEVKSGKSGKLKSLALFLLEKNKDFAVRFYSDLPSIEERNTNISGHRNNKKYKLLSLPLYLVEQLPRLITTI